MREPFAELLFFAVGLGLIDFDAFELLGQMFLGGVGAGAVVVVLVVDSVAQLFADLRDRSGC